jgi:transcriptional regulator with XRE-family HTH domain
LTFSSVERIRSTLLERRLDLGLTVRAEARLAGYSPPTVSRAENGGPVSERVVLELSRVLTELELHQPAPTLGDDLDALVSRLMDAPREAA